MIRFGIYVVSDFNVLFCVVVGWSALRSTVFWCVVLCITLRGVLLCSFIASLCVSFQIFVFRFVSFTFHPFLWFEGRRDCHEDKMKPTAAALPPLPSLGLKGRLCHVAGGCQGRAQHGTVHYRYKC